MKLYDTYLTCSMQAVDAVRLRLQHRGRWVRLLWLFCMTFFCVALTWATVEWHRAQAAAPAIHDAELHAFEVQSSQASDALSKGQQELVGFLSRRYKVSSEAMEYIVRLAYRIGFEEKIDPTLILAIVGIESSYNPYAASHKGAEGLMQVRPMVHEDKFQAVAPNEWSAIDPEHNVRVGVRIIREYTRRTGSVEEGLKWYVGAALTGNDGGYANKVLSLKTKLDGVYNRGYGARKDNI